MIDLHVHTHMSDGEYAPSEIINLAKKEGVRVVSITDHDTLEGIQEAKTEGEKQGIEIVPGVELSSLDNGKEVHVLGYYIDPNNKDIKELCSYNVRKRNERNNKYIELLNSMNVDISIEDVKKTTPSNVISKLHFAQCLLQKKYTTYFREAFKKYFTKKNFKDVRPDYPSVSETIKHIKNAGGIAVLAHPQILNLRYEVLEEKIREWKNAGLDGIECYYTGHTNIQVKKYNELANKYDLIVTAGTDYHGPTISPVVKLGRGMKDNVHITDYSLIDNMKSILQY